MWDFLRGGNQHVGWCVIVGSGDLFRANDCLQMMAYTGVDGVTVARGSIGNPWIFEQCRALAAGLPLPSPPTIAEQAACMREHYRLAEDLYGPRCGPLMRKFGIKYAALHPASQEVREAFVRVGSLDDWEAVLQRWYKS